MEALDRETKNPYPAWESLVGVFLAFLGFCAWCVFSTPTVTPSKYHPHHGATQVIVRMLSDFMQEHGRWPVSQLEFVGPLENLKGGEFLREDLAVVHVEYGCDLKDVAEGSPDHFPWVVPEGPKATKEIEYLFLTLIRVAQYKVSQQEGAKRWKR